MSPRRTPLEKGSPTVAVAYLRVSTEEQRYGPSAQARDVALWAARSGVDLVATYFDNGVSGGAPPDRRPALADALAALRPLGAGILVVQRRDRLARDVGHAVIIERLARSAGARVVSAAGEGNSDDEDDPSARITRGFFDLLAEHERLIIKLRTRNALAAKLRRGEWTGKPRLGWAAEGKRAVPNLAERAMVAYARELRAKGVSFRKLGPALAEAGYLSRRGKPYDAGWLFTFLSRSPAFPDTAAEPLPESIPAEGTTDAETPAE